MHIQFVVDFAVQKSNKIMMCRISLCMQITLYFADLSATAARDRVFDIRINGQTMATGFDVYALGGGDNSAVSFAAPAFYSGSRSNFDVSLPTVVNHIFSLHSSFHHCDWAPLLHAIKICQPSTANVILSMAT